LRQLGFPDTGALLLLLLLSELLFSQIGMMEFNAEATQSL